MDGSKIAKEKLTEGSLVDNKDQSGIGGSAQLSSESVQSGILEAILDENEDKLEEAVNIIKEEGLQKDDQIVLRISVAKSVSQKFSPISEDGNPLVGSPKVKLLKKQTSSREPTEPSVPQPAVEVKDHPKLDALTIPSSSVERKQTRLEYSVTPTGQDAENDAEFVFEFSLNGEALQEFKRLREQRKQLLDEAQSKVDRKIEVERTAQESIDPKSDARRGMHQSQRSTSSRKNSKVQSADENQSSKCILS
jgi:hypothetical protein